MHIIDGFCSDLLKTYTLQNYLSPNIHRTLLLNTLHTYVTQCHNVNMFIIAAIGLSVEC